ncbi:MAG: hypothetical protein JW982_04445 [Spirochaetes bacterium]|nr:hypothetical protein [Spirochaetota bacterium]
METKLTLKLDQNVINSAKAYASKNKKSLSGLVEEYFKNICLNDKENISEINPLVLELSGIISENSIKSYSDDYLKYIENKYE